MGLLPREGIFRGSSILKDNEEIDKSCGEGTAEGTVCAKIIPSFLIVEQVSV